MVVRYHRFSILDARCFMNLHQFSSFFLLAVLAWVGGDFMVFAILVLDIPVDVFQEFPQGFLLCFSVAYKRCCFIEVWDYTHDIITVLKENFITSSHDVVLIFFIFILALATCKVFYSNPRVDIFNSPVCISWTSCCCISTMSKC